MATTMGLTVQQREDIRSVLERLRSIDELTPDNVIAEAKDPSSPLHSQFTWDLSEAALLTWRQQARTLISSFVITETVDRKTYTIQQFVEDPCKSGKEQGYIGFLEIKSSKTLAAEFMERELGIAKTYVSKTMNYAKVLGMEEKVAKVARDLDRLALSARKSAVDKRSGRGRHGVGRIGAVRLGANR